MDPFEWTCHPVHEGRHRTLAWARIDLDWETGETLIEEIQNDRLRDVKALLDSARAGMMDEVSRWGGTMQTSFLADCWERSLRFSRGVWDEAMVCTTLRFIADELGLRKIFYHTPESGRIFKGIDYSEPPRSVYTDLPGKFCFKRTEQAPEFLSRKSKGGRRADFLKLEFCRGCRERMGVDRTADCAAVRFIAGKAACVGNHGLVVFRCHGHLYLRDDSGEIRGGAQALRDSPEYE